MAETSSVASHVLKPCDKVDGAPANGIELQSRIAAFSHQSLADSIAKCLAEVSDLNSDLGSRLSELVGDLISAKDAVREQPELDDASILSTAPKISCANPKGKFDILFTKNNLALRNAKNSVLQVPYSDIKAVYILDNVPAERSGKVYLVLQFKSACSVAHGKRELDNFTFELHDKQKLDVASPQALLQGKEEPNKQNNVLSMQGAAAVVLCGLLGQMQVTTFMAPDKAIFCGRGGAACIGALLKFNQGYLFPLKDALLFIGSQCFVLPHESILGVDMPGAETERRSFDIVFHGYSGETLHELTQVDMRDLPAWGDYMLRSGMKQVAHQDPANELGAGTSTAGKHSTVDGEAGAANTSEMHAAVHIFGEDEEDEEEEDEDFDANAEEDDSEEDEGSQDHYAGGAGLPSAATVSRKRNAPGGDIGASSSKGEAGGSVALAMASGGPQRKRLRSSGVTEGLELPDDVYAAEMGALEEVEEDMDSGEDDSDADEDDI